MRMWMINPKRLCRQHLLGEHNEIHKLVGCLKKNKSIVGYIRNGLVELHNIRIRHEALVEEMTNRGYRHNSPLHFIPHPEWDVVGRVDKIKSLVDLSDRCPECKERMKED